jgi:hypothetical protein
LIGMFEGPFPTTTANEMLVGILNMWSAYYATRFLYSAAEDFRVVLPVLYPSRSPPRMRRMCTSSFPARSQRFAGTPQQE